MLQRGDGLELLDWGRKNLAANRACAARARVLLDDAAARLRRSAELRAFSSQLESPLVVLEGSAPSEPGSSAPRVYIQADGAPPCGRISRTVVPTFAAAIIAEAYELYDPDQVQVDAGELNGWTLPLDEFAAGLGTMHQWTAETVAVYIGALRSALLDRHGPTPWDDL